MPDVDMEDSESITDMGQLHIRYILHSQHSKVVDPFAVQETRVSSNSLLLVFVLLTPLPLHFLIWQ